jgi:hypothetical protein
MKILSTTANFLGSNDVVLEYSAGVADKKLKGIHFDEEGKRRVFPAPAQ